MRPAVCARSSFSFPLSRVITADIALPPPPSSSRQVCIIAAAMTSRSPFVAPLEKRAEANAARCAFGVMRSDPLAVLAAYRAWEVAWSQVGGMEEGGGGREAWEGA